MRVKAGQKILRAEAGEKIPCVEAGGKILRVNAGNKILRAKADKSHRRTGARPAMANYTARNPCMFRFGIGRERCGAREKRSCREGDISEA